MNLLRASLFGAGFLLCTAHLASAQTPRQTSGTGQAPAAPGLSLPVEQHQTKNGLTVLLSPDHRLPVVAVEMRYLVGSGHEQAGRTGFAHLFEHLMFQGSEHYDEEYFKPFEPVGGQVNGSTNTDRTNFFEQVPKNYLELALWLESDRMGGLLPALSLAKLDNQRDVVKNERRQSYENTPYAMMWLYLAEALYPDGHPYRHPTIGSHGDLTAATLDDVKAFFKRYYVPANAVLTIVGDFDTPSTLQLVERYFGSLPSGARARAPVVPPGDAKAPSLHLTKTDNVELPQVNFAWRTPALYADGDAAMDLLASILSDGKTSRLYKALVYDQRVAKDVAVYQASDQLGSAFVVQATAAPGKSVTELGQALFTALKTALATPPTPEEMHRTLNNWRKDFFLRIEGVLSRAELLSTYYHAAGTPQYLEQDLARYTSLTANAVHAAASRLIDLNQFVRIDIVPGTKDPKGDTTGTPGAGQHLRAAPHLRSASQVTP